MTKRKTYRLLSLLICLLMLPGLCSCGGEEARGYMIVDTIEKSGFVMAFREGDMVGEYVKAALSVLAAHDSISDLEREWLDSEECQIKGDENALDGFGQIPTRDFILGFSPTSAPMSFDDNGSYRGFDISLASRVCLVLGWKLKLLPINMSDVVSELRSGNIDAAWGGLYEGIEGEGITVTEPYLELGFVLVSRLESGLKSTRSLKGKYLSMGANSVFSDVLDENESLRDSLGSISRLSSGNAGCFAELDSGACDVILVDSLAAAYYMK